MIRTDAARTAERRAWQDRVNRALRESSPADCLERAERKLDEAEGARA